VIVTPFFCRHSTYAFISVPPRPPFAVAGSAPPPPPQAAAPNSTAQELREVEIGLVGDATTRITEGLAGGERVVLREASTGTQQSGGTGFGGGVRGGGGLGVLTGGGGPAGGGFPGGGAPNRGGR
jgi:hypothetical protein